MATALAGEAQAPSPVQPSLTRADAPSATNPERSTTTKPIHSLVLDTGPLIKNEISVSTLISHAEVLYTIPAVISEIRDEATRSRLETTLVPFLTLRSPSPQSVKFVTDFARKSGDLAVLSKPDIHLIALTYELECERNGGDWRLRKEPGQKSVNGKSPAKIAEENARKESEETKPSETEGSVEEGATSGEGNTDGQTEPNAVEQPANGQDGGAAVQTIDTRLEKLALEDVTTASDALSANEPAAAAQDASIPEAVEDGDSDDDSDSDGWITPSNIKKHQANSGSNPASSSQQKPQTVLQAALLTSDYAMQNVSLRINLNLIGNSLSRITHVRTWVLRCHGCFAVSKQTDKQFCPSCGQPTLTRVACSTDREGNFRVHLKRNFQYNKRGNVYSIPKPVHGSANGKISAVSGGGKHGWGKELILAEDQKEYTRRMEDEKRTKYRDAMDEDYLPDLLTGRRTGGGGERARVGAGKNVNSKRRR